MGSPITEVDVITHLECISPTLFAYALKNGTVGVYKMQGGLTGTSSASNAPTSGDQWATRLWRMAAKHQVRGLKLIEGVGGIITAPKNASQSLVVPSPMINYSSPTEALMSGATMNSPTVLAEGVCCLCLLAGSSPAPRHLLLTFLQHEKEDGFLEAVRCSI